MILLLCDQACAAQVEKKGTQGVQGKGVNAEDELYPIISFIGGEGHTLDPAKQEGLAPRFKGGHDAPGFWA
jgi:hypothetical protein